MLIASEAIVSPLPGSTVLIASQVITSKVIVDPPESTVLIDPEVIIDLPRINSGDHLSSLTSLT